MTRRAAKDAGPSVDDLVNHLFVTLADTDIPLPLAVQALRATTELFERLERMDRPLLSRVEPSAGDMA